MKDALRKFVDWLKKQPIILPLLLILKSRKGLIATALTTGIIVLLPQLEKVHSEVDVVVLALVSIVVTWLATSLGYALEDSAAKGALPAVATTTSTAGPTTTTTVSGPAVIAPLATSSEVYGMPPLGQPQG